MHATARQSWLILALAGAVSGCASEERANQGFTAPESAGITIVESFEPAWEEGEGWTLSAEPILDIGVIEGDPVYQLSELEDVARRPDGQVVVVNVGTGEGYEILVFTPRGGLTRILRRLGWSRGIRSTS